MKKRRKKKDKAAAKLSSEDNIKESAYKELISDFKNREVNLEKELIRAKVREAELLRQNALILKQSIENQKQPVVTGTEDLNARSPEPGSKRQHPKKGNSDKTQVLER